MDFTHTHSRKAISFLSRAVIPRAQGPPPPQPLAPHPPMSYFSRRCWGALKPGGLQGNIANQPCETYSASAQGSPPREGEGRPQGRARAAHTARFQPIVAILQPRSGPCFSSPLLQADKSLQVKLKDGLASTSGAPGLSRAKRVPRSPFSVLGVRRKIGSSLQDFCPFGNNPEGPFAQHLRRVPPPLVLGVKCETGSSLQDFCPIGNNPAGPSAQH